MARRSVAGVCWKLALVVALVGCDEGSRAGALVAADAAYATTCDVREVIPPDDAHIDHELASSSLAHDVAHAYQDHAYRCLELATALHEAGDEPEAALLRAVIEGQAMAVQGMLEARRLDVPPAPAGPESRGLRARCRSLAAGRAGGLCAPGGAILAANHRHDYAARS